MPAPSWTSTSTQTTTEKPVAPTPLSAALGILVTGVTGVRRLPARAVRTPIVLVQKGLMLPFTLKREYDAFADRGQALINRLRHGAGTLEDAVGEDLQSALGVGRAVVNTAVGGVRDTLDGAADR